MIFLDNKSRDTVRLKSALRSLEHWSTQSKSTRAGGVFLRIKFDSDLTYGYSNVSEFETSVIE